MIVYKGPLSQVMKLSRKWVFFFTGITFGQYGFGLIWRVKK